MTYTAPVYRLITPPVLSNWSQWSGYSAFAHGAPGSPVVDVTGPAANLAIYTPIVVTSPATFRRGFWWNGSVPDATCNVDVGIFTPDGVKRGSTGSVAKSGASVIQSAAFTASYDAAPGVYYIGIIYSVGADANGCMGNTANLSRGQWSGMYQQAVGSFPLPSTATFATFGSNIQPLYGITQTTFAI